MTVPTNLRFEPKNWDRFENLYDVLLLHMGLHSYPPKTTAWGCLLDTKFKLGWTKHQSTSGVFFVLFLIHKTGFCGPSSHTKKRKDCFLSCGSKPPGSSNREQRARETRVEGRGVSHTTSHFSGTNKPTRYRLTWTYSPPWNPDILRTKTLGLKRHINTIVKDVTLEIIYVLKVRFVGYKRNYENIKKFYNFGDIGGKPLQNLRGQKTIYP